MPIVLFWRISFTPVHLHANQYYRLREDIELLLY
jgi:hypothetical protein